MGLGVEAPFELCSNARLADAGFAGDQNDLAVAGLSARPTPQQQADFLLATDQWGQSRSAQRLEPARDGARTQNLPGRHRRSDAFDLGGAEIAIFEKIA